MESGCPGEFAPHIVQSAPTVKCALCDTAFGIIHGDAPTPHTCLDRRPYALCENCVIEVGDWDRIVADLDELCGCDDCWPVLEQLWVDRENLFHERRPVGGS